MALDRDLARRYGALFAAYGIGANYLLLETKRWIAERVEVLREDAMYFLLVNMDHMVIRPICGYVPMPGDEIGRPMPPFRDDQEVSRMVRDTIDIIMEQLREERTGEKYSANAVIRAISVKTQAISEKVAWWREE